MSLVIRRIQIGNFRKFRKAIEIDGLSDGLNIIIEPNETGKSTLLDALRAAFFVRYNTRNQLAQSFAPYGDAVGPEVQVAFEVDGQAWSVNKRFLRGAVVEISSPQGRAQGEEAETRLNALLGSVRDTSRSGDVANYGTLGHLWVAQTDALYLSAPGQIVRDSIASTLEAEVGSIMGGDAYNRVRERIEGQYDLYWTPTGQKKGRQTDARERFETAEALAKEANERLAGLEQNFAEVEAARARLKIILREIADETDLEARKGLVASLDVARSAAQILVTRRAEQEAINRQVTGLADLRQRHLDTSAARTKAEQALAKASTEREAVEEALRAARQKATDARDDLEKARNKRQLAREALAQGEDLMRKRRQSVAIASARKRHGNLLALEKRQIVAKATAGTLIDAGVMAALEGHERAVAQAQAVVNAGAIRITLSGNAQGITIDDQVMEPGERVLTHAARIRFAEAELLVSPPEAVASAEETLASALRKRKDAFDALGVADMAAARARNEAARDAAADQRTLEAEIAAVTMADELLQLAGGAAALKLFIAGLDPQEAAPEPAELPDIAVLAGAVEAAEADAARAEGTQDSAIKSLQHEEQADAPHAAAQAGASSDLANAQATLDEIEGRQEWPTIEADLTKARETAASASVKLEEASRDAAVHDVGAITRKIEIIDARARTANESRVKLETDIARLEGTIESEGGLGLAQRAAAAQDETEAARASLLRVTEEAETLKLLRSTLEAARRETSAKFVGPVAVRAKRYIERILPGSELTFSQDLGLESIARAGVDEHCASLSKGTQEQLAVLTRIAFADMLLEQGKPVSLILDDPLVYSDDGRLDTMIEILSEAALRMQIILLTCRDRAFRHVSGTRITL